MSSSAIKKVGSKVSQADVVEPSTSKPQTCKDKLVGFIGQRCCWRPDDACCESCKNVWRVWIGVASFFTLVFSALEFALMIYVFLPYSDNRSIFVADKMRKLFMLSEAMFPIWLLTTATSTFFMSLWSLIFAIQPDKGNPTALIVYRCISSIVVISVLMLSIVQVVLYIIEWPDDKYKMELERTMRNDMEFGRPPDLIRKTWVDTQDTFQCCGIYSWNDWFSLSPNYTSHRRNVNANGGSFEKELPLSCCDSGNEFCFESRVWKVGCLEAQISQMKSYSLFNTIFTYFLYFLLDWLSTSTAKFFYKFPAPEPEPADEESPPTNKKPTSQLKIQKFTSNSGHTLPRKKSSLWRNSGIRQNRRSSIDDVDTRASYPLKNPSDSQKLIANSVKSAGTYTSLNQKPGKKSQSRVFTESSMEEDLDDALVIVHPRSFQYNDD